jgi:hypothetical protein
MKVSTTPILNALLVTVFAGALATGVSARQATDALSTAPSGAPTINQSLEMRSASAPRISPDGRWVAYEITRTNIKKWTVGSPAKFL